MISCNMLPPDLVAWWSAAAGLVAGPRDETCCGLLSRDETCCGLLAPAACGEDGGEVADAGMAGVAGVTAPAPTGVGVPVAAEAASAVREAAAEVAVREAAVASAALALPTRWPTIDCHGDGCNGCNGRP